MVEDFYGLKRKPFRVAPNATEVFVGPQTAKVMQSMKKALDAQDAVVAILGPAGVGKSALVKRSLTAIGSNVCAIRVPRMQVAHDEVLEFLLDALDARDIPAGTIRKITLFRKLLAERARGGARIVIVVEDAVRLGTEVLAELEALSAADGLDHEGANLVLMGVPAMLPLLKGDDLARLAQRIRLYQHVQPLAAAEMLGYFKHCFRLVGGDFDHIFAAGSAALLHELSGGIPRVANNLVESVVTAAAESRKQPIDIETITRVANDEYGLTATTPVAAAASEPAPKKPAEPTSRQNEDTQQRVPDPAPVPVTPAAGGAASADCEIPDLIQDTLPDLETLAPGLTESAAGAGAKDAANDAGKSAFGTDTDDEEDIPTLFSSHRMEAPVASKSAATHDEAGIDESAPAARTASPAAGKDSDGHASSAGPPDSPAETPVPPAAPNPAVTLSRPDAREASTPETTAAAATPEASPPPAEEPPAWDRDPTLAELRPDIAALEEAMAGFAVPDEQDKGEKQGADETPDVELRDPTIPSLPEITLDSAIDCSVAEATAALEKADRASNDGGGEDSTASDAAQSAPPAAAAAAVPSAGVESPAAPKARDTRADAEMDKIAAGLSRARSLEDVDDMMAETLFGAEISTIAAQAVANPPLAESAHQAADAKPQPVAEPPPAANSQPATAAGTAGDNPRSALEQEFMDVYGEDALNVSIETETPRAGLDLSASQRLATVRALNAGNRGPAAAAGNGNRDNGSNGAGAAPSRRPQSIEDQIDTSITQTLKALKRRPADNDDDDDDDDRKSGFFSRFRRP